MELRRNPGDGEIRIGVILEDGGHVGSLIDDDRHEKVAEHNKEKGHLEECDNRCDNSAFELEQLAVELHERLEQIGDETPHEEGEKHPFEDVEEPKGSRKEHTVDDESDGAVKIVALAYYHGGSELIQFATKLLKKITNTIYFAYFCVQ